jgi:sugar O-acyltransferase (sialic acid O-acetyltransferase NeuD family)
VSSAVQSGAKPVVVVGAGGHAVVVLAALQAVNVAVAGLLDSDSSRHGSQILGVDILGDDNIVRSAGVSEFALVNGIGGTLNTDERRRVFEKFRTIGFEFPPVVHPSAIGANLAELGDGAQVMAGAVLQPRTRIGANTIVNTGALIDHDCTLGDHVHIAPGATLSGGVSVGPGVMIGAGATIIQNVVVGDGAFVAAGATVVSDVAAGARVGGTPARKI